LVLLLCASLPVAGLVGPVRRGTVLILSQY